MNKKERASKGVLGQIPGAIALIINENRQAARKLLKKCNKIVTKVRLYL